MTMIVVMMIVMIVVVMRMVMIMIVIMMIVMIMMRMMMIVTMMIVIIMLRMVQTEEELSRKQLKIKLNAKPMMHHQALEQLDMVFDVLTGSWSEKKSYLHVTYGLTIC